MATTTSNKRKKAVAATVAAAAILLAGTFAWTSISQQAKNEAIVDINPGGRLHDDFNGTNKDVYVENFSSGATGVPIYARIRLDQYLELGPEAGENLKEEMGTRNVKAVIGTDSDDVTTWETYKPGEKIESGTVQALEYWQWTLGNADSHKPVYLPTFNMNKDSLAADRNGTWQGTVEGDIVHYDDYLTYEKDQKITGTEVYDWDDENNDEEPDPDITKVETTPRDSADVYHKENQTHTATEISSGAVVITMAQWLDPDGTYKGQPGPYWVYDTDGWAYWAQAIQPQTTTGLLLDSIHMNKTPDENYYYGINVVGQFATVGDLSAFGKGDEKLTDDAKKLLETIANKDLDEEEGGQQETVSWTEVKLSGADDVLAGETAAFSAVLLTNGKDAETQPAFTWSLSGATQTGTTINQQGVVTVSADEPADTALTVTAKTADGESASKTVTVRAKGAVDVWQVEDDGDTYLMPYGLMNNVRDAYVYNETGEILTLRFSKAVNIDKCSMEGESPLEFKLKEGTDNVIQVTMNGIPSTTYSDDMHGVLRRCRQLEVETTDGENVYIYIYERQKKSAGMTLSYTHDGTKTSFTSADNDVVLEDGDILAIEKFEDWEGNPSYSEWNFYDLSGNKLNDYSVDTAAGDGTLTVAETAPDSRVVIVRVTAQTIGETVGMLYYDEFTLIIKKADTK